MSKCNIFMESTHLLRSQINLAFQHADCTNQDGNQDKINKDVMASFG